MSTRISWLADVAEEEGPAAQARAMRDVALAKKIGEHLDQKYPKHHFHTLVDSENGIARILHPLLPVTWGMTVLLEHLKCDPSMRCVTRAAGEILERLEMPRTRITRDLYREASQRHWKLKHGIFPIETNWVTGKSRRVLPPELVR